MARGNKVFASITPPTIQSVTSVVGVNDIFLHSLFARIALSNNDVIEFQTRYSKETDTIELMIPDGQMEIFDQITGMQRGNRFKAFINWLIGSETLTATATLDQDPNFISAGALSIWVGATQGSVGTNKLTLLLPTTELSVIGYNFKVGSSGGSLKVSLVWIYDSGSNNSFNVNTSVDISAISGGVPVSSSGNTSISTFNLINGDIRETELLTVADVSQDDIVSIMVRRNYNGSPDPKTDLVGVLGLKIEFV